MFPNNLCPSIYYTDRKHKVTALDLDVNPADFVDKSHSIKRPKKVQAALRLFLALFHELIYGVSLIVKGGWLRLS